MIAHKKDHRGRVCYYLGESGCSIQDSKPTQCRQMDCRNLARTFSYTYAKKLNRAGSMSIGVWNRGLELINLQD